MTVAEIKARNMIKEKSTEQLLDLWMMISNTVSVDAAMVHLHTHVVYIFSSFFDLAIDY